MIRRFLVLKNAFCDNREECFEAYESLGGKYMGEPAVTNAKKKKKMKALAASSSVYEEDFE